MRLMSDGGSHNVLQNRPVVYRTRGCDPRPSSALYGQSVPGGVVNLTSKRPQFSQQGHIRLTGGTQNTKGAAFDYTDAINDQWAWRLIGMTRSSDTQYDHTPRRALRDFAFPAVAAGQRHLAAAARLSAKRSFRRLPRLFAAGRHPLRAQWP
ncbi:hypothetical protein LN650_12115 [Klebsiella pneumoniae subsp. pneumoniae]|nr:hypothetical protein [Klebsiella pneumoniae subsp. pneumoniae]